MHITSIKLFSVFNIIVMSFLYRDLSDIALLKKRLKSLYRELAKKYHPDMSVGSRLHILHILVCNVLTRPYTLSD